MSAPGSREDVPAREQAAYEFLSRAFRLRTQISSRSAQIRALYEQTTRLSAPVDGMPRSGGLPHGYEAILARIADMQTEMADGMMDLMDELEDIRKVIAQVRNPDYRAVLEFRYLSFLPWKKIGLEVPYSRACLMNYHRRGLMEVGEILERREAAAGAEGK